MKTILLFLFFYTISFGQSDGIGVEVRLLDGASASDSGLINILNSNNVLSFEHKIGHHYPGLQNRIYQVFGGDNLNSLLADLTSYSTIVESASLVNANIFNDCCSAQIVNSDVGIPIGSENNIVITNDSQLNDIFTSYNVYYYSQSYPTSTWPSTLRYYFIACNCDVNLLRGALEEYTAVIETTEPSGAGYLAVNHNTLSSVKIYPNPFTNSFQIESVMDVENYSLADVSGKLIINTGSYDILQNQVQNLKSGIYFLKMKFRDGIFETRKIIKN